VNLRARWTSLTPMRRVLALCGALLGGMLVLCCGVGVSEVATHDFSPKAHVVPVTTPSATPATVDTAPSPPDSPSPSPSPSPTASPTPAPAVTTKVAPPPPPPVTELPPVDNGGGGDQGGNVYYKNCTAARAAGAAPLFRGEPGYRPALDRDGDGIACE
jgi:hypothetical protein